LIGFTLDRVVNGYFKLIYYQPRPYMLDLNVHSYTCAKGFGSPSGHSSSAWSFPIILFLDIFHGMPIKEKNTKLVYFMFPSWFTYLLVLSLAIFWSFIIPYSRYVLGAHSLN